MNLAHGSPYDRARAVTARALELAPNPATAYASATGVLQYKLARALQALDRYASRTETATAPETDADCRAARETLLEIENVFP